MPTDNTTVNEVIDGKPGDENVEVEGQIRSLLKSANGPHPFYHAPVLP